jgi:hypothetical protein
MLDGGGPNIAVVVSFFAKRKNDMRDNLSTALYLSLCRGVHPVSGFLLTRRSRRSALLQLRISRSGVVEF